ncbi:MAG TPA: hypothetical protein VK050_06365 [Flavobacteriaceae bacterium]|nr:hypothetical protein [Flavobacteriaceae bacterium]
MTENKFFDIPLEATPKQGASGGFISKYLASHFERISNVKDYVKRLPTEEEFMFLQTDKQFNAFTFIPFICSEKSIEHLYATTYSINRRVVESLTELHNTGYIDKITICVNDSIISRNPTVVDLLRTANKEYPNFQILFTWAHAKVAMAKTKEDYFVIEGSGNWSENAMYEQYTFANSKALFEFRKQLVTETQVRHEIIQGELIGS